VVLGVSELDEGYWECIQELVEFHEEIHLFFLMVLHQFQK